jgi:Flp pilus assembly protein TadB
MQDFAYLFGDSVAAWLRGRGDARFQRYERHYRAERQATPSTETFNLERSNEQYAKRYARSGGRVLRVLDSRAFRHVVFFLALVWGGSLLLSTVGKQQPVIAGTLLAALFVAVRVNRRRTRSTRR